MKQHFTDQEFNSINKVFGNLFNVRFNKVGNITLEWKIPYTYSSYNRYTGKSTKTKFFTFYRPDWNEGKIIIRVVTKDNFGHYNYYPLNMKNRKRIRTKYGSWFSFNINNCYFNTMNEAIDYFDKYINRYHSRLIRKQLINS